MQATVYKRVLRSSSATALADCLQLRVCHSLLLDERATAAPLCTVSQHLWGTEGIPFSSELLIRMIRNVRFIYIPHRSRGGAVARKLFCQPGGAGFMCIWRWHCFRDHMQFHLLFRFLADHSWPVSAAGLVLFLQAALYCCHLFDQ